MPQLLPQKDVDFFIPVTAVPADIGFYLDELGVIPYTPGSLTVSECEITSTEVFILIECEGTTSPTGASFIIDVFPEIEDVVEVIVSEDGCSVEVLVDCADYIIENDNGTGTTVALSPGDPDKVVFYTVTSSLAPNWCNTYITDVLLSCVPTGISTQFESLSWFQQNGVIQVNLPNNQQKDLEASLVDLSGKTFSRVQAENGLLRFEEASLPPGVYLILLESESSLTSLKVYLN